MKNKLFKLSKSKKPIIGMIHLDYLPGQIGFKGFDFLIKKALEDLQALEKGGVEGVMIENWKDETDNPFVSTNIIEDLIKVSDIITKNTNLPIGINVLPNDYRAAFLIAKKCNLKFIQSDVFVDHVRTNYSYSNQKPFEIKVDLKDFENQRKKYNCENVLVFASIHPKHYITLENKTILESAKEALANKADVIVITGKITGEEPILENVKKIKENIKNIILFVGSGLNENNAKSLLEYADGAIVGTAFKTPDFEKVVICKVKNIMNNIKNF